MTSKPNAIPFLIGRDQIFAIQTIGSQYQLVMYPVSRRGYPVFDSVSPFHGVRANTLLSPIELSSDDISRFSCLLWVGKFCSGPSDSMAIVDKIGIQTITGQRLTVTGSFVSTTSQRGSGLGYRVQAAQLSPIFHAIVRSHITWADIIVKVFATVSSLHKVFISSTRAAKSCCDVLLRRKSNVFQPRFLVELLVLPKIVSSMMGWQRWK